MMQVITLNLTDYYKNIIKLRNAKNILDSINSQDLCYIIDDCRPIFVNSTSFTDMDKLLGFLIKNSSNLYIIDKTNNQKMLQEDFFKLIVDKTTEAKYDYDKIINMTNNGFINNIKNKLYLDNSLTIWYDKINKFK